MENQILSKPHYYVVFQWLEDDDQPTRVTDTKTQQGLKEWVDCYLKQNNIKEVRRVLQFISWKDIINKKDTVSIIDIHYSNFYYDDDIVLEDNMLHVPLINNPDIGYFWAVVIPCDSPHHIMLRKPKCMSVKEFKQYFPNAPVF